MIYPTYLSDLYIIEQSKGLTDVATLVKDSAGHYLERVSGACIVVVF